jgi:hypothetical protein
LLLDVENHLPQSISLLHRLTMSLSMVAKWPAHTP